MEFTAETIAKALIAIYGKEQFDIDSELEAHIFEETRRIFAQAAAEGIADSVENGADVPGDEFLKALRESVDVFSAFRTHRMQNDIAAQLTDEKGQLKPFSRFAKDVQPYVRHQNRAWLRTEYDTAVRRAHQAADWQQFEAEKDVLPNLEWIPSTSPTPGADHRVFWGTVLPVDDPFWKEHRPGDRWNCKCELRATDKDCTARPSGTEKDNPQSGLENNPGKDGHLFSDKHPYYPDSCASCQFSGNKLMALFYDLAGSKKHCNSCRKVEKVVKESTREEKQRRKRIDENRKLYDKLSKDSRYKDVEFDPETGGVKATHRGHNTHPNDKVKFFGNMTGDQLENEIMELLYKNGHSVIFCDESKKNRQGLTMRALDMQLDGKMMDIKSVTRVTKAYGYDLLHKNGQLCGYNNRTDVHEKADTVCLYFHDPKMYSSKGVKRGISFLLKERPNTPLKHVVCILKTGENDMKMLQFDVKK